MRIYIDQTKLKRRALSSHGASLGGFFLLMAGILLPMVVHWPAIITEIMIIVGILVSMAGIYFANRWVRRPRPEDSLADALKTLTDDYHLYNYTGLPFSHVLLMPNGVVAIETINLAGEFSYLSGRWKEKMNIGRMLRYPFEEHLGDPTRKARLNEEGLKSQLRDSLGVSKSIPLSSVVVFLHPLVKLEAKGAPVPVCKIDKLRKVVVAKAPKMDPQSYEKISAFLEKTTLGY